MTQAPDVFDEAHYVAFSEDNELIAVWHGGHTINLYAPSRRYNDEFNPVDAISVGGFEAGETTLSDVKEGIEILWDTRERGGSE